VKTSGVAQLSTGGNKGLRISINEKRSSLHRGETGIAQYRISHNKRIEKGQSVPQRYENTSDIERVLFLQNFALRKIKSTRYEFS